MTMVIDPVERQQIAEMVERALGPHQPREYRIEVDRENILQEDDWYQVLVKTPGDVRTYDFYNALAEAEAQLQDQQGKQILLVPVEGD